MKEVNDENVEELLEKWLDNYIALKIRSNKIIEGYKQKIKKVRKYQVELDEGFMSVKKEIVKKNRSLLEKEHIKKKLKLIRDGKYGY